MWVKEGYDPGQGQRCTTFAKSFVEDCCLSGRRSEPLQEACRSVLYGSGHYDLWLVGIENETEYSEYRKRNAV